MYFYHKNINNGIWETFCIILTVLSTLQNSSLALKCYICGDPDNFLLNLDTKQQLKPVSCDELSRLRNDTIKPDASEEQMKLLEKFTMKCPENYQGCITQIQDGKITRSCDVMPIDDCQTANGVTYCYCSYDMCNIDDETKSLSIPSRSQTSFKSLIAETSGSYQQYSDDEDYFEMSGDKNLDVIKEFDSEKQSKSEFDISDDSNDLNRIAKEHNERVSTILKIISTQSSPTTANIPLTISINNSITHGNTTKSTIQSTTTETTIPMIKKLITTKLTTTTPVISTHRNENYLWTFKHNNNNDDHHLEHSTVTTTRTTTTTKKIIIDNFPTTSIYNRNSNTNKNNSNLINFAIHLILIPSILVFNF